MDHPRSAFGGTHPLKGPSPDAWHLSAMRGGGSDLTGQTGIQTDLAAWLRARDWMRIQRHFTSVAPVTAAEFASRGLATQAMQPGAQGARQALPDLQRAFELQPHSAAMASNLLQGLIDAGEITEACEMAAEMVQQAPHQADLRDKRVQALMVAARWDEALQAAATGPEALRNELGSRWWQPVALGDIRLRLPEAGDDLFIARCFRDPAFMNRFHRFQPGDDVAVAQFIARAASRPRRSRRLDWIVCSAGRAIGLTSLVDIDPGNRRAELLVGLPQAGHGGSAALQASLGAMQFAFDRLGLHKLASHVYGDNPAAQANTLHLGLRQEGLLREHLQIDGQAIDLYVNGLLAREFHADARLQRMLRRWAVADPR